MRGGISFAALLGCLVVAGPANAETASFAYTGDEQIFIVPDRVVSVQVTAVGAPGASGFTAVGGPGSVATANVAVTPGERLFVVVGGPGGARPSPMGNAGGPGGFNGGGPGGTAGSGGGGGGGGGASDVRTLSINDPATVSSRLVVAAGGGGAGNGVGGPGDQPGQGGGGSNCTIPARGGGAGTNSAGGVAGAPATAGAVSGAAGTPGVLALGGTGAAGLGVGAGGGGGGVYGGGGGGGQAVSGPALCGAAGGGGGGSGFAPSATETSIVPTTTMVPSVTLTYAPDLTPPETAISRHPKKRSTKRKATFEFTASEAAATFTCKLDRKPATACTSPRRYKRLKPGKHKFTVFATDDVGNIEAEPAKFKFRVKRG